MACALELGLLDADERPAMVQQLRAAIRAADGRPTFGIWGAKWVPRALSNAGLAHEAFDLITGAGFPGWAYWLEQGATTLWEDWHGENSRNHIMFGDISAWIFEFLGGVAPISHAAGFQRFRVAPQFVQQLNWFKARHLSPQGPIRVEWQRAGHAVELEIEVPGNSRAELVLAGTNSPQNLASGVHRFEIAN